MSIKSKNDIPYLKFLELQEAIKGNEKDDLFVANEILKIFYPKETNILLAENFANVLVTDCTPKANFRLQMPTLSRAASLFISADTYADRLEFMELFKLVMKPKYYWSKPIKYNDISLADAEYVIRSFMTALPNLKSRLSGFTARPKLAQ